MKPDLRKSKKELTDELRALRIRSAETVILQERLKDVEKSYHELQNRFAELSKKHEHECYEKDRTEETLNMAQVIINNSPAIL